MGRKRTPKRPPKPTKDSVKPPKLQEGLTNRQALFVQEYLKDFNATQAAIRAGYAKKSANREGPKLLSNPVIAAGVAKAQEQVKKKFEITIDEIAAEMKNLGFANMQDYMSIGPDGDPVLDWSKLTREQAAALAEVTVEDFKDGRGKGARDVRKVRFKLADKRQSLVDLARLCGLLGPEKVEHSGKLEVTNLEKERERASKMTQEQLNAERKLAAKFLADWNALQASRKPAQEAPQS